MGYFILLELKGNFKDYSTEKGPPSSMVKLGFLSKFVRDEKTSGHAVGEDGGGHASRNEVNKSTMKERVGCPPYTRPNHEI